MTAFEELVESCRGLHLSPDGAGVAESFNQGISAQVWEHYAWAKLLCPPEKEKEEGEGEGEREWELLSRGLFCVLPPGSASDIKYVRDQLDSPLARETLREFLAARLRADPAAMVTGLEGERVPAEWLKERGDLCSKAARLADQHLARLAVAHTATARTSEDDLW